MTDAKKPAGINLNLELPPAPKAPDSSFKIRLKSALVLAPAVIAILWYGGFPFALLMIAAAGVSMQEWTNMVGEKPRREMLWLCIGLMVVAAAAAALLKSPNIAFVVMAAMSFLIYAANWRLEGKNTGLLVFGFLYIGYAFAQMLWLRLGTDQGLYNLLLLLFIVWASDIFAYITGKSLGGPKLAPAISPKKTWSGFIGSSIGAGIVAAGFACPAALDYWQLQSFGGLGYVGLFALGFVLAMVGQAGDLFISMFKRKFGVKDTGTIIPGHGGILDRIDALILVAILFATIARVLGV